MFIAILVTNIMSVQDRIVVKGKLDKLLGSQNWSIDLNDDEKILRVILKTNLLGQVYDILAKQAFKACLLNIYHCDYGIEYPLIPTGINTSNQTGISAHLSKRFFAAVSYDSDAVQTRFLENFKSDR